MSKRIHKVTNDEMIHRLLENAEAVLNQPNGITLEDCLSDLNGGMEVVPLAERLRASVEVVRCAFPDPARRRKS